MNPLPLPPVFPTAINHLLAQQRWARDRLVHHAGKTAWLDLGVITIRLQVAPDGMVEAAADDATPNVTIRLKLADLPLILQHRERAFSYVTIDGDADFANTISQLSQSLRWEAEDDLRKWVGDIAAMRLVSTAKAIASNFAQTHQKLAENTAEYSLEEQPLLIRPQAVADFTAGVTRLRDDVERMQKRIEKIQTHLNDV